MQCKLHWNICLCNHLVLLPSYSFTSSVVLFDKPVCNPLSSLALWKLPNPKFLLARVPLTHTPSEPWGGTYFQPKSHVFLYGTPFLWVRTLFQHCNAMHWLHSDGSSKTPLLFPSYGCFRVKKSSPTPLSDFVFHQQLHREGWTLDKVTWEGFVCIL